MHVPWWWASSARGTGLEPQETFTSLRGYSQCGEGRGCKNLGDELMLKRGKHQARDNGTHIIPTSIFRQEAGTQFFQTNGLFVSLGPKNNCKSKWTSPTLKIRSRSRNVESSPKAKATSPGTILQGIGRKFPSFPLSSSLWSPQFLPLKSQVPPYSR